jgi:hypothetical protein
MSSNITLVSKGKTLFLLPVKIQGDSYSFVIVEYDNQIPLSLTNVRENGTN